MRRRQFIKLIGGAAAAWPLAARAQQSTNKVPLVGVLWHAGSAEEEDVWLSVLVKAFNDLGYVEGKNIHLDHRFPAEKPERFRTLAQELVDEKPDVVIAVTWLGASELKKATDTIPTVFVVVNDPVGFGFAQSLGHPGGNMTGLSLMTIDLSGKRLSLLKEAVPNLSRVALLTDVTDTFRERTIKAFLASAETLGISLWPVLISKPDEIEPAFDKISQDHADGIVRGTGSMLTVERARLGALSLKHRLPVMTYVAEEVPHGYLIVWPGLPRLLPPRGCLHRQNTERRKACRSSHRATDEIQARS